MAKILGIDTSNYTTSVAVVKDGEILYDARKLLNVEQGQRGLRQSDALFQHVKNLPDLLNSPFTKGIDAVCVSTRPRPVEGSYMPVFKAGESIASSIAYTSGVPIYKTSHQEGHLEGACRSINFSYKEFIAVHMSGGTTEILKVSKDNDYSVEIIGGTKDISIGQFIDRIGVAMGLSFPAGKDIDELAIKPCDTNLRIPSKVDGFYFNFSGQETLGLKYIEEGYNKEEIAKAVMICISKTLEKVFNNLLKTNELPILLVGGVASSIFLKCYFKEKYKDIIFFSDNKYASDNAAGCAFIGLEKYKR
ncbi:O-sialoglycoprotein endopeptidase [Fervidicella metallireducens AeB]|uniref:N(6)-L-threonylcarbamoyladenine synthase n=1 Tax=Fervidicella metallireducens AeB TaxID=1403537 RepID=A0A017RZ65_9CLOT|nr:hypothetical protein [Fervidicella metallireducens]EYE89699.1 O-sialoglycoprotein endopeptidase [Fervidicella metallireducens AeB]